MGGTPLPPFTDKIFGKKGVTDLGGVPPPPFTDKIRKVVFEVPPKVIIKISILSLYDPFDDCAVPHCSSGLLGGELPFYKSHSRSGKYQDNDW